MTNTAIVATFIIVLQLVTITVTSSYVFNQQSYSFHRHAMLYSRCSSTFTSIDQRIRPASQQQRSLEQHTTIIMGLRGKRRRAELRQLKQQPTPALIRTPYGPIRPSSQPRLCITCAGRGRVRCPVCEGRGLIRATGPTKYNRIDLSRMIGSRWTSVEIREGHRQYTVSETRGSPKQKNAMQVRMSNCCGPEEERVHIWISMEELRNKNVWRVGWTTLQDIKLANHGALIDVAACFRCKGDRVCDCDECGGVGKGEYLCMVR